MENYMEFNYGEICLSVRNLAKSVLTIKEMCFASTALLVMGDYIGNYFNSLYTDYSF